MWTESEEQFAATVSVEPVGSRAYSDAWKVASSTAGLGWRRTSGGSSITRIIGDSEEFVMGVRHRGVEIRDTGDLVALDLPPITTGYLEMWRADVGQVFQPNLAHSQPLIGLDMELNVVGDGRRGLGVPGALLTPTAPLLQSLTLHPAGPIGFGDDVGPGMSLVTWRTDYDISDYHLPIANAAGCADHDQARPSRSSC